MRVKGYIDASFQSDQDDLMSQSGFVFCLNGGAVSCKSSKQDTVVDSTCKAEYIAIGIVAKEVVWMRKFIDELGVVPTIVDLIVLYCDNNGAITLAKETRSHQQSKYKLQKYHLIREFKARGDIHISEVSTTENIVDPLTKPLS